MATGSWEESPSSHPNCNISTSMWICQQLNTISRANSHTVGTNRLIPCKVLLPKVQRNGCWDKTSLVAVQQYPTCSAKKDLQYSWANYSCRTGVQCTNGDVQLAYHRDLTQVPIQEVIPFAQSRALFSELWSTIQGRVTLYMMVMLPERLCATTSKHACTK